MASQRYVAGCEYVGTKFFGWQTQHGLPTVAGSIQDALSFVAAHEVWVQGSGRTDRGVHALNQVFHFDSAAVRSVDQWLLGINSRLPAEIKCKWLLPIADAFHARFAARARTYKYTIFNQRFASVWQHDRAWWLPYELDFSAMEQAAQVLVGQHDFSGFRGRDCQAKSPIKTILSIDFERQQDQWSLIIKGESFLHHMVRNIVGALVAIGRQKFDQVWLQEVLTATARHPQVNMAPACGLYFIAAHYSGEFQHLNHQMAATSTKS